MFHSFTMKAKGSQTNISQKKCCYFCLLVFLCYPNFLFSQSKDMVKLEWYHYIILSPMLIIDAVDKSYSKTTKGIQDYIENRKLPDLHKAVLQADMEKIQKLVKAGVPLEAKDKKGETALFYALDRNLVNIARFLIQNKSDVNVTNTNGRHAVQSAIANNQYDLVKMMLDHGLELEFSKQGGTVLTFASSQTPTNFKIIQLFIDRGVKINVKDKYHYSALMYLTTKESPNLDLIKYMIKKGADLNAKDKDGKSILRILVEARTINKPLVQFLVENGADINSKDKEGKTIFDFINDYYDSPETDEIAIYLKKFSKKK